MNTSLHHRNRINILPYQTWISRNAIISCQCMTLIMFIACIHAFPFSSYLYRWYSTGKCAAWTCIPMSFTIVNTSKLLDVLNGLHSYFCLSAAHLVVYLMHIEIMISIVFPQKCDIQLEKKTTPINQGWTTIKVKCFIKETVLSIIQSKYPLMMEYSSASSD